MAPDFIYRSEAFAEDLADDHGFGGAQARARGLPRWAPALLVAFAFVADALLSVWLPDV